MNEKTQTLVRYDMEEDATHGVVALQRPDGIWVHYDAAAAALTALARDLAAARQERDAAPTPAVVQDAAPEWCHAESPKPREDDDPFVCTLKRGHAGNHIAEDVYGQVQDSWPAAAKAGGEAVRLAREIVNSWACVARTKRDLDYIHACHKKIDALEAAAPTLSPAQRETLTIFADCIDDELSGSETRGFTEAVVAVDRERYDALRAALAATETPSALELLAAMVAVTPETLSAGR